MDLPSTSVSNNLCDLCPGCSTNVRPVVVTQASPRVTAAYRCHLCRYDWIAEWQTGYVKTNPTLNDISQPIASPNVTTVNNNPVCQACGAPPGAMHAIACPHP